LKQLYRQIPKANLTTRNFPLTVAELRKRSNIKEGGEAAPPQAASGGGGQSRGRGPGAGADQAAHGAAAARPEGRGGEEADR